MNKGQSILELIIAISIFVIVASSGVVAILGSYQTTRLGEEETRATFLALEGYQAVDSIEKESWNALTDGTFGVDIVAGKWQLVSSPTTHFNKYTRTITISPVYRDINGNIAQDGDYDSDSKNIFVSVSWNYSPARELAVEYPGLLTNWSKALNKSPQFITDSCLDMCRDNNFDSGTCRGNNNECATYNETYLPSGDIYCNLDSQHDTCCCL
jgi:type II secretory pathway pseudopilin PulG